MNTYESPTIKEVGSVRELTLSLHGTGSSDNIFGFRFGS